ncbi:hypothetical protein LCGC14_2134440, partial [marine sediment metagenome]
AWTKTEPPLSASSILHKCFYDYDETAKYGFTSNLTVVYHFSPNYASSMIFASTPDRIERIWPGYYFNSARIIEGSSITPSGFDLADCGNPGSATVGNLGNLWTSYWLPDIEPGCAININYGIGVDGVQAPSSNSNYVDDNEGQSDVQKRGFAGKETTIADCHKRWEQSESNLRQCLKLAAIVQLKSNNDLFGFGISAIRMTFSFILLMFYILSITIIGYVFATLVPSVFRKIMMMFSRATRLK